MSFVKDFSGIDVDDMLQLRNKKKLKKKKKKMDMLLHMCSICACHRNLLSTMRPSRRCSVTFSIF